MAKALLSSLDRVSVGEREKEREREIECLVQRACIINEITLADGSYLGNVPQPPRFAAGSHAHIYTHTHTCFSSLLLSVPLTVYHSLFSLFSLCASLIQPFYPPLCACLLFIERFGWSVQAFRPKNYCHAPPRSPSACPTPPPFIAFSARIRICPHLEQKAFIPGWLPPACSLKKSFICHNPLQ